MRNGSKVLIIGGGIGGLVAALALRRLGIDVVVFEQAPELSEIGSGITLWTNAVKALRHLDAADFVGSSGNFIERGELRSWHGDVLVVTAVGTSGGNSERLLCVCIGWSCNERSSGSWSQVSSI